MKKLKKLSHFLPLATLIQTGIGNIVIKTKGVQSNATKKSPKNKKKPFHENKS
jgi:hypothetical protein